MNDTKMRYFVFMDGEIIGGLGEALEGEETEEMLEENAQFKIWELPRMVYEYIGFIMDRLAEEGEIGVEERVKVVPVEEEQKADPFGKIVYENHEDGSTTAKVRLDPRIEAHLQKKREESERREKERLERLLHNHGPVAKGKEESQEGADRQAWLRLALDGDIRM